MATSLYQELTALGIVDPDAQLLHQHYDGEPDWVTGLETLARAYFGNTAPPQAPLSGQPWATLYQSIASSNGAGPRTAIENAVAALPPEVQLPLFDAMAKTWQRISATQGSGTKRRRGPRLVEYHQALSKLGYSFRMNECLDEIEVNGSPITDAIRAEIRARMRDVGFENMAAVEDAYTLQAHGCRYHPVQEYLQGLAYDGGPHIANLAGHFTDKDGVFSIWLRRWLIGAVAKVHKSEQNAMLVLDGPQGIGKSHLARWLCPQQLGGYFVEKSINPDDKDDCIRLASTWIWEVAELGSTTRKADREALKFFLTQRTVTIRRPYGRYDLRKPALASFIGTVNNDAGILSDRTGNRRFLVCTLTAVDWGYSTKIDPGQVWAEAQAAYLAGEPWQLLPDEALRAGELNENYEMPDPVEGLLLELFEVDPTLPVWTPTAVILQTLEANGLRGQTRANAMALAGTLRALGLEKTKSSNSSGQRVWGYRGIKLLSTLPASKVGP